uniref:Peptidase_M16 domain-containing protein n=1 Tax=Haemonchus placei TaxID=6290 RepID=A0A0N4WAE6_HAEPC
LEEKDRALYAEPDCSSFLQTKLNPAPEKSFAVETVIRAGCSTDAVLLTEKLETSPSGLEGLLTRFSVEDGARLATQLEKELTEEWCSTSLFGGLGTDRAGL